MTMFWPRFVVSSLVAIVNILMLIRLHSNARAYRQNGINGEVELVLRASIKRAWARLGLALTTMVTAVIPHQPLGGDAIDRWIIFWGMTMTLWLSTTALTDMRRADALAAEQLRNKYAMAPPDEEGC